MTDTPGCLAPATSSRTRLLGEMAQAHEALLALFGGVQSADPPAALAALERLAGIGERLDCPELVAWCRGDARASAGASLERFVRSMPELLQVWERAQDAVIAREFPLR